MNERSSIMSRMFLLLGLLLLLPTAILLQMVRVGLFEGEGYRELWSSQAIDFEAIPAERGHIYDSRGALLASNQVIYKIAVDPKSFNNSDDPTTIANVLSKYTGISAQIYRNKIRNAPSHSRYIVLERSVPVQTYEELSELQIRGVILEEEYRRVYNFESLASHVVGFVNHNLDGMAGLESQYNNILKGTNGLQQVRKDRNNKIFAYVGAPRKTPVQGYSLHTTIDSQIQAIVEEELANGVEHHKAKQATAIVLNPKTGAVKAIANVPTYNPNSPASSPNENRRNYAVSDMLEPGSTFKLTTAIAAVEQNVVQFSDSFKTPDNGVKMIHGQAMRDHDPLGTLDFTEVITKSSNIATSEIAMRLKPETFFQYARNMGFGTPTHIDLPNEESGRLQRPYEWSLVTLPWMSIGYEVQVTPIQIIQSYAAFANGGRLMKPFVVESIVNEMGDIVEQRKPTHVRNIAKSSTIKKLQPVFEKVVSDSGTAGWASVDGLRIAGKTGTAQKYIDGRYRAQYNASFIGYFPVEDPEFIVLVIMDEPRTSIYGGFTAGSVFKEIATRISSLGNAIERTPSQKNMVVNEGFKTPSLIGLNREQAQKILATTGLPFQTEGNGQLIVSQTPEPGEQITENTVISLSLEENTNDSIPDGYSSIPDLTGLNMRQATRLILSNGFKIQTVGSGTIYTQFPRAGDLMQKGKTITVRGKAKAFSVSTSIASN